MRHCVAAAMSIGFTFLLTMCSQIEAQTLPFKFTVIVVNYGAAYLQINTEVDAGRTVSVIQCTAVSETDTIVCNYYKVHVSLQIANDSLNGIKNITRERIIVPLGYMFCPFSAIKIRQILVTYNSHVDTVTDFKVDNRSYMIMTVCPTVECNFVPIEISAEDSLLHLLLDEYIRSKYVYLAKGHVDNDTVQTSNDVFNKHDIILNEKYIFDIKEQYKGTCGRDLIAFFSGNTSYHYISTDNDGNPIYFEDSIKTSGSNLMAPKYFTCAEEGPVYASCTDLCLIFNESDSMVYDVNPGFPVGGLCGCPYYLFRSELEAEGTCHMRRALPVINDTICFSNTTKLPLASFLQAINSTSNINCSNGNTSKFGLIQYSNPLRPQVKIKITTTEKPVALFVYDTSGKLREHSGDVKTGEINWNTSEWKAGIYILKVQAGPETMYRKVLLNK